MSNHGVRRGVSGTMPPPMRVPRSACFLAVSLISAAAFALTLGSCAEDHASGGALDPIATLGEVGRAPGQLVFPRAMSADGDRLIVVDKTARIQRLDASSGAFIDGFRTPEMELGKPTGLCVAPHPGDPSRTALYVADTHYHRVLVYDLGADLGDDPASPRAPEMSFGAYGTEPGQFVYPTDVAVLLDDAGRVDRLYVSEYGGNDRVTVFDVTAESTGRVRFTPIKTFGRFGVPGEEGATEPLFNRPQSLVIDPTNHELLICDACNHRVGRFTLDGELIAWTGSPRDVSAQPGKLSFPYALALLEDSTVLIAEFGASRVQHMDLRTGQCLGIYGQPGRARGQLATPWAIQVIGDVAYVLDSGNDRIIAFRSPRRGAGGAQ